MNEQTLAAFTAALMLGILLPLLGWQGCQVVSGSSPSCFLPNGVWRVFSLGDWWLGS